MKEKTLQQMHVAAINQLHKSKKVLDGLKGKMDNAQKQYNDALATLTDIELQLGIKQPAPKPEQIKREPTRVLNPDNFRMPTPQEIYNSEELL